jgi:nicotinamide riboside kinase
VFQAFLTTFLIDSGYKTPIQNIEELFSSDIKLAYQQEYNFIFENGDETEKSIVQNKRVNCPSYNVCENWAKYQKNVSILVVDKLAEDIYARG